MVTSVGIHCCIPNLKRLMEQLKMHLCFNSLHYLEGGGHLELRSLCGLERRILTHSPNPPSNHQQVVQACQQRHSSGSVFAGFCLSHARPEAWQQFRLGSPRLDTRKIVTDIPEAPYLHSQNNTVQPYLIGRNGPHLRHISPS